MPRNDDKSGPDGIAARVAARQHGVITTGQLLNAGVLSSGISDRVANGRLHRVHQGVYAVGHTALSERERWMAAVMACGEGAVLSHLSAAELWEIRRRPRRLSIAGEGWAAVHVTVPGSAGKRKRDGIVLHRSSTLAARDCTRLDGIPVTRPARTLSDLRPLLSPAEFGRALREAGFLRLPLDPGNSPDDGKSASSGDRSELESLFLALCRRHRLPKPAVNAPLDRFVVDFLWPDVRLVIEVDGWMSHGGRSAFEEDRARDARLALLGYEVVRFTWRQLTRDPRGVATTIRAILWARS